MSTRWIVTAKLSNGKYGTIYVHNDGYPQYAFKMLQENYTNQEKIDSLIDLGDCSVVDVDIETCIAYHRDRGESLQETKASISNSALVSRKNHGDRGEDYKYLWDGEKWTIS